MGQPSRIALRYYGGKGRLAKKVIALFPRHVCYVEPYGGAASVLLQKPASYAEVYNDLYHEVVSFFRVLREQPAELIAQIELTPFAREELMRAAEPTEDEVELARRLYVRSWQGRGRLGTKGAGGWRFSRTDARSTTVVDDWTNTRHLWTVAERFRQVQIECDDALRVIGRFDEATTLFYVDPPYPASTRCKRWRSEGYVHEMSDDDHRELATVVRGIEGMAIISGYRCELYDALYADWERVELQAYADGPAGAVERTEVLWLSPAAVAARSQFVQGALV